MVVVTAILWNDNTRGYLSYDALVNGLVPDVPLALYIQQIKVRPYNHLLGRMAISIVSNCDTWGQYCFDFWRCF